nr:MAG TPA: hypothetical protein [Caudoviricetes sp.]DAX11455.1 MAG TPA: hypothetical protein [Bacteriophage sp.]
MYSLCFKPKTEVTYNLSFIFSFRLLLFSLFTAQFTGMNIEATEAK